MIRYAYAAAAAVLACAPAEAVVIQSGQVNLGFFQFGEQLQPGETRTYRLDLDGTIESARQVKYVESLEYRAIPGGGLAISSIPYELGCAQLAGFNCFVNLSGSTSRTVFFDVTGQPNVGTIADCTNGSPAVPCHIFIRNTGWYVRGFASSPVSFTLSLVPEPSAWALFIVGFGGIGVFTRSARLQRRRLLA